MGTGIGIDMVESENIPIQIPVGENKVKDFHTGMNTMLILDEADNVYKTGLKLDYSPAKIKLNEEFTKDSKIAGMTCGRRHYVLWNDKNQMLVWGSVLKEKPQSEVDGFGLHFGDALFDQGRIK